MSKNSPSNDAVFVIPMAKGYVRGYYERRNGKLVYINPYQNSKGRKKDAPSVQQKVDLPVARAPKPKFKENAGGVSAKPVSVDSRKDSSLNFILEIIIHIVKTIDSFEPGERVRLSAAVQTAKSIVREMGYLDDGIVAYFDIPKAKSTKLSHGAARETAAMAKQLNRLTRRVTRATIREKIQRMSLQLSEEL
jgi:hypothetical protein